MDYPIQLKQPDIEQYRQGNCGIPYVYQFSGERQGPHVWLNAITHGDEVCGAIALAELLESNIRPLLGKLTISFANISAFGNVSEDNPLGTRYFDEDMNRVWDKLEGPLDSYEKRRAKELQPIADSADYLIDLHAMYHPSETLSIVGKACSKTVVARGIKLAQSIGHPTLLIADNGHFAGCRLRDYNRFGDNDSSATALVIECGGWWEAKSVEVARSVINRLLCALGMLEENQASVSPPDASNQPFRLVEATTTVTIATDHFKFVQPFKGDEIIPNAGTLIAMDGEAEVRTPVENCFLMFPTREPKIDETAVRLGRFTEL